MCSFANTVNAQKNFMEGWDGGDAVDVGSELTNSVGSPITRLGLDRD